MNRRDNAAKRRINSKFSIFKSQLFQGVLGGEGGVGAVFDFEDGGGFEDFDAVPLAFGDLHAVIADGGLRRGIGRKI